MKSKRRNEINGFTLIELLLLMVVISMALYSGISLVEVQSLQSKIDKTTLQLQQIESAALSYYVSHGAWPETAGQGWPGTGINCLKGDGSKTSANTNCDVAYLPENLGNAFGSYSGAFFGTYEAPDAAQQGTYQVIAPVSAGTSTMAVANAIAAKLPLSATTDVIGNPSLPPCKNTDTTCFVFTMVTVPGLNMNNATGANFAGIFHHGACVPAPICPNDIKGTPMTPQIIVVPVQVSGPNSNNTSPPLASFTAFALPTSPTVPSGTTPPNCYPSGSTSDGDDCTSSSNGPAAGNYWRVCMQVITENGDVATSNSSNWGNQVSMVAFTRCSIAGETAGTNFNVYSY